MKSNLIVNVNRTKFMKQYITKTTLTEQLPMILLKRGQNTSMNTQNS